MSTATAAVMICKVLVLIYIVFAKQDEVEGESEDGAVHEHASQTEPRNAMGFRRSFGRSPSELDREPRRMSRDERSVAM